jgi:hypothetical protein
MMAEVYAFASMIIVWLGLLDLESEKAVEYIMRRKQQEELDSQERP